MPTHVWIHDADLLTHQCAVFVDARVISPSPQIRTLASSYRFMGAFGGGLLVSIFVRPVVKWLGGGATKPGKSSTS